jgi:peptidoglycan/xylan/chitin deacetylase (PgdA/CDA1 family)
MPVSAHVRRLATPIFHRAIARRTALRFAAHGRRSLVLLYHRVLPDDREPDPIVPSVPVSLFRRQLESLLIAGDIVSLRELVESTPVPRGPRPRFALTFDDDHDGYVDVVLPVLRGCGASATFFLSCRALHGLPPYWWARVENSLRTRGLDFTRKALGVDGNTIADIVVALERSGQAAELADELPPVGESAMTAGDIRALARSAGTIGFHTLNHPVLTMQPEGELAAILSLGRRELAAAAGVSIDFLAYPHGRADASVAEAAEASGYSAAFMTGGRPITPTSDRFLLDRWEPGRLGIEDFIAELAMRLLRPPTSPRAKLRKRLTHAVTPTVVTDLDSE